MVERYPDTVTLIVASEPTQDENGDLVDGSFETNDYNCRVKPTSERWVRGDNGELTNFNYTLSMPLIIDYNFSGGQATFNGKTYEILRFHNYQNRTKIWI